MTDWKSYLRTFHDARPGITEEMLVGCLDADGATPYRWLIEAVPSGAGFMVELACGSSPLLPLVAQRLVLGVDRSWGELQRAAAAGARVVCADAGGIPIPDGAADVVACSMALMLMNPLERVFAEISRVLRPGGALVATVPCSTPLTSRDLWVYGRLLTALHIRGLGYPDAVENVDTRLAAAGMVLREDSRRRFAFTVATPADVDLFLRSLYLPGVQDSAIEDSRRLLGRAARRGAGLQLGIPIRRIVAFRC